MTANRGGRQRPPRILLTGTPLVGSKSGLYNEEGVPAQGGRAVFIDVNLLERRKLEFDEVSPAGALKFPEEWKQSGDVRAMGSAELLDRAGSRTIRVRGTIQGRLEACCSRCLEPMVQAFDNAFELYYYPMALIARNESVPIDREDTNIGFYEGNGLDLADVVREQVMLWLPMRGLCREDCQGICPTCGVNRNREKCQCVQTFDDPRWDALKRLHFKTKS
jgi:uncharacterized protein